MLSLCTHEDILLCPLVTPMVLLGNLLRTVEEF